MRKFIVSDLHGNGEVYNSIMGYLENISLVEDVELFINGDLIDRGIDSFTMLMDVYERINGKGNVKIKYLGGNHELMMWQALKERKPGKNVRSWCKWMCNGGWVIEGELDSRDDGEELYNIFCKFLGNLDIYYKFEETVKDNNILLVHAQPPKNIRDDCHMKILHNDERVEKAVWMRKECDSNKHIILGKEGYLTIIGHTPVSEKRGFIYDKEDNVFNIDGGCATYANCVFDYKSVPLVEVLDGYIKLIIFNHNNEIVDGFIFDGDMFGMCTRDIEKERVFLNHNLDDCEEKQKEEIKRTHRILTKG